jgi:hypothetical protein
VVKTEDGIKCCLGRTAIHLRTVAQTIWKSDGVMISVEY